MSNLWTHLVRGDVALAVTLTALSAAGAVDLPPRQVITLPMEIGVRNSVRAATLASAPQFPGRPEVGLMRASTA